MANQKETQQSALPDALRYDETTLDYIEAESEEDDGEELPQPSGPHTEELDDGEQYIVRDPAAKTFDLDHSAPLKAGELREIDSVLKEETDLELNPGLTAERQAPLDEAMKPIEQEMTASEMVQDDHINERQMIDQGEIIKDVLDPVETE